ncbi:MAG: 50S ribosomal protein L32 [Candidatus Omnitrophica bacterium CG11_big_fil_rev_8_21_14_0_20_42_13]|uniref:Large ribosomal subunit protein bL32 n=1 Tax=Candidatus Ghiorseimicrobium undicola TaxID=1974746 RepID=A0A2H0LW28_9BACT|nr:MAG: 50S ribosomal protein L32 [Candidatus Omnitrophica bacterium CG11_big_fil_rev_8_21_14_0_20_42_13]
MPLPKRRFSKTRSRKKRTHKKIKATLLSVCPQCKQPKLSHRICPTCGYYKGRQVIEIKDKSEKKGEK